MKTYNVNHIPLNQLIITGNGSDKLWKNAASLTDFCSPWEDFKDIGTTFEALWDGEYLFFLFKVWDTSIHVDQTDNSHHSINGSDRVELFFRVDTSLNPYYCLEIDPTPRIMDFKAYPDKKFDFGWNWPLKDLVVKSSLNAEGFYVEGKISLTSMKGLGLIHEDKIETGIFRAKYVKEKDSIHKPIWITWVNPKTEMPNFHIPSSFGVLKLK